MADPNHLLLEEWKVCFMLPCKVGNSSIKAAICDTISAPYKGMHQGERWHHATKEEIAALPDEWIVIGFIRNPYDRFMSAWRNKMRDEDLWKRIGLPHKPTVEETAKWLPRINDQHWRKLVDELMLDGEMLPDLIIRTDRLGKAWKYVQRAVDGHCGVKVADVPHLNKTAPSGPLRGPAKELVRDWYIEDFKAFGYRV